jgi:hypothetical protein
VVGRIRFALERLDSPRHSSQVAQLFSLGVMSRFMKSSTPLIIAALLVSLFTGCSKHSPPAEPATQAARPTPVAPSNLISAQLGVVEVSDGVPSRHDIGGGRVCIIKPFILKDGDIMMAISVAETNASGDKNISSLHVETSPDQAVEMANGVVAISLTPHITK